MIVISSALVLSEAEGINLTNPLIGWHNLVTAAGIVATTEAAGFPASNLANPSTNLKWRGVVDSPAATEYLRITTAYVGLTDYVAVARHNWGSANIPVSIGYWDSSSPPVWVELVEEVILADDGPMLFRYVPTSLADIYIRLQPGDAAPEAAVVYWGELLVMERGLHMTPHTPLDYGRVATALDGMSTSGEFLGTVVVGEYSESAAEFQHLTPGWYRESFDPFVIAAKAKPFFFAWKPQEYPFEVGYARLTVSPKPAVDPATGRMGVVLAMRGIA